MKRFKISFLVFVAIITLNFAISENVEVVKIMLNESTRCYKSVDMKSVCSNPTTTYLECQNSCPGESNGLTGAHIWTLSINSYYNLVNGAKPIECGLSADYFCCVTIEEDNVPCISPPVVQPMIDVDGSGPIPSRRYKVVRTFCRRC